MVDEAEEVSGVEVRLAAVVPDIQLEAGLDQLSLTLLTGGSPARALLEVSLHQSSNVLRHLASITSTRPHFVLGTGVLSIADVICSLIPLSYLTLRQSSCLLRSAAVLQIRFDEGCERPEEMSSLLSVDCRTRPDLLAGLLLASWVATLRARLCW